MIPARTGSVVLLCHFFDGPDDSPEFRWNRTKIKGSCTSKVGMAKNGQKQGWAPKNDPLLGNGKFLWGGSDGKVVAPGIVVICSINCWGLSAPRFPLPGSWPAPTSLAGTRQGARPDGEEKKIFDATNVQSHYILQRVAALYFMCALYSAAGRRGNPMPDNLTLVSGQ